MQPGSIVEGPGSYLTGAFPFFLPLTALQLRSRQLSTIAGMDPHLSFLLNVGAALLMGVAIGIERQIRQHPAGLRTTALVCVGAALFVSLSILTDDKPPIHMAAYVVSGIGFLGGGVILREGMNVKGMNTAATLWCSAAVGILAGAGLLSYAFGATLAVLILHIVLRPCSHWIDVRVKKFEDVDTAYKLQVVCQGKDEGLIRSIVLRHLNAHAKMNVHGISTQDSAEADQTIVVVEIFSSERNDRALQDVMSRLNIEPGVKSVRWEKG
jgi:putative Mg2+ transporter-C (MgtC) family protein